jgi:hypothetical protein
MKARVLLISALALTVILAAGYFLIIEVYFTGRIDRARTQITDAVNRITDLQAKTKLIPVLREKNLGRSQTAQSLHARLVRPDRVSETLADVQKLCRQYQIKLVRVSFSPDSLLSGMKLPPGARESTPLPVMMELQGQFLDAGMLIDRLGQAPYAISVTDFRIVRPEKQKTLTIELRTWLRIAREV